MASELHVLCRQDNEQFLQSKDHSQNELLRQLLSLPIIERELLSELTVVSLTENQVLYKQGDHIECIYFPLDSVVSGVSITEDGSAIETSMVGCEGLAGVCALINGEVAQQWIWVTIGGSAIRVEAKLLGKLLVHNETALRSFRSDPHPD